MHVVHVVHGLATGGTETGVVNLVNGLGAGLRHSVVSMTASGGLAAQLPTSVAVHALAKRPGIDLRAIVRLAALLRRLTPDIVHSRNWGAFDAVLAARLAGVPAVVHGEHGREATDPRGLNGRRNALRRLLAPLVDRFVTVSFELRRWLIDVVRVPGHKVVTIHNGVDTRRFCAGTRDPGRRRLGLPPDLLVVGTVGRLDPVKDQLRLLDAFARLEGVEPSRALVVVGDGPARGALERRAAEPDLAGQVHFLGERRDVPVLLHGMDVYALPSVAEGLSNTLLEAMATGLPVVATRAGGNPEVVEDGVTGVLVPVGEAAALAAALAAYLGDPRLRALHGAAARARAVERFGLERMLAAYRGLYSSLAGARKKGRPSERTRPGVGLRHPSGP